MYVEGHQLQDNMLLVTPPTNLPITSVMLFFYYAREGTVQYST